jgi:hypothetical protein
MRKVADRDRGGAAWQMGFSTVEMTVALLIIASFWRWR